MAVNNSKFDVIIIGGGPAGLSAALWCSDVGLDALIVEKEAEPGGQLLWTFNAIKNYLGSNAANGRELCDSFLKTLNNRDVRKRLSTTVTAVDLRKKTVTTANGSVYSGGAIIIATGVRRRNLDVPGEQEFSGRGVLESGAKERNNVAGKTVVIVGGGDAALENALILGETAKHVLVIHRRNRFTARHDFIESAKREPNIELLVGKRIAAIIGDVRVEAVEFVDIASGELSTVSADSVLIRIGVEPNTDMFKGQIRLDAKCYVITNSDQSCDITGVYAIGDVANPSAPTISSAVGQGASAVKAIYELLSFI
ncbi:thioredoxin-disulfide reductase [soil metagenome]